MRSCFLKQKTSFGIRKIFQTSWAELCQAQVKLEVVVEFGVKDEAFHYKSRWIVVGEWVVGFGGWTYMIRLKYLTIPK